MKLSRFAFLFATVAMSGLAMAAEGENESLLKTPSESLITAITTLIVFLALVIILTKFAWGPISKSLSEREAKIRRDIDEAEAARRAAEAKQAEYQAQLAKAGDEVRSILDKAQADAQAVAARIKLQAQQETEEAKERAMRDIEASRKAAVADIHEQAATISTAIAEKILRRNINADDQRDLVRSALEQLGSN